MKLYELLSRVTFDDCFKRLTKSKDMDEQTKKDIYEIIEQIKKRSLSR